MTTKAMRKNACIAVLIIWLSNIMLRSPLSGSDQRGYASATIVRQLNSSALLPEMGTGAPEAPVPLYRTSQDTPLVDSAGRELASQTRTASIAHRPLFIAW